MTRRLAAPTTATTAALLPVLPARGGDGGQAVPFVGLLLALGVALVLGLGHIGAMLVESAAARTAADAAALAGAGGDEDDARQVAVENGAELVSYRQAGDETQVTVRVGRAQATARARRTVEVVAPARRSVPVRVS